MDPGFRRDDGEGWREIAVVPAKAGAQALTLRNIGCTNCRHSSESWNPSCLFGTCEAEEKRAPAFAGKTVKHGVWGMSARPQ